MLYLPTNVAIGDLCVVVNASQNVTLRMQMPAVQIVESFGPWKGEITAAGSSVLNAGASAVTTQQELGNSTPAPGNNTLVARWNQVEIFFAMCCLLTVLGCIAIVFAMFTNAVNRKLKKRDVSLHQATSKTQNLYEDDALDEAASDPLLKGSANGGGEDNAAEVPTTARAHVYFKKKLEWTFMEHQIRALELVAKSFMLICTYFV